MINGLLRNGSQIFTRKQSSIFSAATILAGTFGLSALLGILRDRFLYAEFYACCASQLDAYNAAFRIPDIIFRLLIIGALSAAFIPVFSQEIAKNHKQAHQMASSIVNILFLAVGGLSLLAAIFALPLSQLIAGGFGQQQVLLMSQISRVMILAQLFFLLSNFATGILQTHRRFLVPALSPLAYNLGIIFGIKVLSGHFGIFGPALGVVLGACLHFLIQVPVLRTVGFSYFPMISFKLTGVRRVLKLMLPRTLALGLGEIEATAVLFFASTLTAGSLSLFYLGQHLAGFVSRLFGTTLGQASLPILSGVAGKGDMDTFRRILIDTVLQAVYFVVPVAIIVLILRIPIVRLAYGTAQFPWQATLTTGRILLFLSPLMVASALIDILTRAFYAMQDTKTPLIVSLISLSVGVSASALTVFGFGWGTIGLALAASLSGLVHLLALSFLIVKKVNGGGVSQRIIVPTTKIILSGAVAAVWAWSLMQVSDNYLFDTSRAVGLLAVLLLSTAGSLLLYFLVSLLFGLKEARTVLSLGKRALSLLKPIDQVVEPPPID
ncbi:MAG: murein biosynthesis integral membrane protein MurJ [Patescibacteria group bacterium]